MAKNFLVLLGMAVFSMDLSYGAIKKIHQFENQLEGVQKNLSSIEKKTKEGQRELLSILQEKTKIKMKLIQMEENYQEEKLIVDQAMVKIQSDLFQLSVANTEEIEDSLVLASRLYAKRQLEQSLKRKLKSYKELKERLLDGEEKILVFQKKLNELQFLENNLSLKILELEEKGQKKKKLYLNLQKKRKEKFTFPVKNFSSVSYHKKGIYFTVQGAQEVFAAQDGHIIYSGPMANYGNVLMIQHSGSKISVYLGPFSPKVRAYQSVQQGDLIGYINPLNNAPGQFYFEVRRKNKAQKTILFMDKDQLRANNLL